jgi:hypothetical protein
LKNAGAIIPSVIDCVDFSINEQCLQFNECDIYATFIEYNKPVFHVEYPKGEDVSTDDPVDEKTRENICDNPTTEGFSTIIKNISLDEWIEAC